MSEQKMNELLSLIRTRKEAQTFLASLLLNFSGELASERLTEIARTSKQSRSVAAKRLSYRILNTLLDY